MVDNFILKKNMIISRTNKFDPVLKIFSFIFFLVSIILSVRFLHLFLLFILLIIMIIESKTSFKLYFLALKKMLILLCLIVFIGFVSNESLILILFSIVKIMLFVFSSTLFMYTTSNKAFSYGIKKIFKPFGVIFKKINYFVLIVTLSFRFFPLLGEEFNKIYKSQISRGIDYKNMKLKEKIKIFKSIFIPVFMASIKKSDCLAESMELKFYNLNKIRTEIDVYKWHLYDVLIFFSGLFILCFIIKGV